MGVWESLQYSRQYQQHNSNTLLIIFTKINASSNRFILHMNIRTRMRTHYFRWTSGRSRTAWIQKKITRAMSSVKGYNAARHPKHVMSFAERMSRLKVVRFWNARIDVVVPPFTNLRIKVAMHNMVYMPMKHSVWLSLFVAKFVHMIYFWLNLQWQTNCTVLFRRLFKMTPVSTRYRYARAVSTWPVRLISPTIHAVRVLHELSNNSFGLAVQMSYVKQRSLKMSLVRRRCRQSLGKRERGRGV